MTRARSGPRRRLATFSDQIEAIHGLSQLARVDGDETALAACRKAADALIALQLGDGAWPWIYDPIRGIVVEPFELYSVHQDSMAMIGLHGVGHATGDDRYLEAAIRGMDFNYGQNPLGAQMVDSDARVIHRSIRRRGRSPRVQRARSIARSFTSRPAAAADPKELEIDRSMRSYHLGWILEAWAGREELARD